MMTIVLPRVLQHAATHYNITQCTTLQHTHKIEDTGECSNTLQHTATHCNTLQYTHKIEDADDDQLWCQGRCNTLHHAATHYNTLQHTATHSQDGRRNW